MENWKDKIVNSLEGIEKAQPSADAFLKFQENVADLQSQKKSEQIQWLAAAAVIALVICSNIFFIKNYYNSDSSIESSTNYSSVISSYNIYQE